MTSQRRTARRANAGGAPASERLSIGSISAASTSSRSASSRSRVGLAGEQRGNVALGDRRGEREQLVADPVATVGGICVRRVGHGLQAECRAERNGLCPADGEQRSARPDACGHGAHPGQTVEPAAAQEVEQHGLGLVVGGVSGEHTGGEHGVAGRSGAGLEVRAGLDHDALGPEPGAEARRRCRDDVGLGLRTRS